MFVNRFLTFCQVPNDICYGVLNFICNIFKYTTSSIFYSNAWLEINFLNFCRCNSKFFSVYFRNTDIYVTWLSTINNKEVFAVTGWWPRRSRPMPN